MQRKSDDGNILIVGAGVAGLTLAALLRQQGKEPVVIEKRTEQSFHDAGYMLGLLPLGGRVLNALGKQSAYIGQSCSMKEYNIFDSRGSKLNAYPLTKINDRFGPYRGISRIALIHILLDASGDTPVYYDSTVKDISQRDKEVVVVFSDNSTAQFDLVVIADGLHSKTRLQILDKNECKYQQTGWGGWVSWIESVPGYANSYNEFWGAGSFLGLYPVKDQIGAFLGGPIKKLKNTGCKAFAKEIKQSFNNPIVPLREALHSFATIQDPYFWNFHDCRTGRWRDNRVILLGDAATGFLPTAGIGASMAMDSAAALNDELSRADNEHLNYALQLFENRQRHKVEKAQKESRDIGKWMFVESAALAWARNKMLPFYTVDRMLKGLESIIMGK